MWILVYTIVGVPIYDSYLILEVILEMTACFPLLFEGKRPRRTGI
jgi:hypothetical protein